MVKKKKITTRILFDLFVDIRYLIETNITFTHNEDLYLFKNIFRVTTSHKQLFFTFQNLDETYVKLHSAGAILRKFTKKFKFFKKSIFSIIPLNIAITKVFYDFLDRLYVLECLNNSKKQFLFLKRLLNSSTVKVKFIIFKKTWTYTTKPVKRIKKKIRILLKNI